MVYDDNNNDDGLWRGAGSNNENLEVVHHDDRGFGAPPRDQDDFGFYDASFAASNESNSGESQLSADNLAINDYQDQHGQQIGLSAFRASLPADFDSFEPSEKIEYFNQKSISEDVLRAEGISESDIEWMRANGYTGSPSDSSNNPVTNEFRVLVFEQSQNDSSESADNLIIGNSNLGYEVVSAQSTASSTLTAHSNSTVASNNSTSHSIGDYSIENSIASVDNPRDGQDYVDHALEEENSFDEVRSTTVGTTIGIQSQTSSNIDTSSVGNGSTSTDASSASSDERHANQPWYVKAQQEDPNFRYTFNPDASSSSSRSGARSWGGGFGGFGSGFGSDGDNYAADDGTTDGIQAEIDRMSSSGSSGYDSYGLGDSNEISSGYISGSTSEVSSEALAAAADIATGGYNGGAGQQVATSSATVVAATEASVSTNETPVTDANNLSSTLDTNSVVNGSIVNSVSVNDSSGDETQTVGHSLTQLDDLQNSASSAANNSEVPEPESADHNSTLAPTTVDQRGNPQFVLPNGETVSFNEKAYPRAASNFQSLSPEITAEIFAMPHEKVELFLNLIVAEVEIPKGLKADTFWQWQLKSFNGESLIAPQVQNAIPNANEFSYSLETEIPGGITGYIGSLSIARNGSEFVFSTNGHVLSALTTNGDLTNELRDQNNNPIELGAGGMDVWIVRSDGARFRLPLESADQLYGRGNAGLGLDTESRAALRSDYLLGKLPTELIDQMLSPTQQAELPIMGVPKEVLEKIEYGTPVYQLGFPGWTKGDSDNAKLVGATASFVSLRQDGQMAIKIEHSESNPFLGSGASGGGYYIKVDGQLYQIAINSSGARVEGASYNFGVPIVQGNGPLAWNGLTAQTVEVATQGNSRGSGSGSNPPPGP